MPPATLTDAPSASAAPSSRARAVLGVSEFIARYQGKSYQLVAGKAVAMSKNNITHASLAAALVSLLLAALQGRCKVLVGDVGIITKPEKPATVRGADLVVVSHERMKAQDKKSPFFTIAPELIIEISSPSNSFDDLMAKADEFFSIGVEAFWIVDPARQQVLICSSSSDIKVLRSSKKDSVKGTGILKGITLPLKEIFA